MRRPLAVVLLSLTLAGCGSGAADEPPSEAEPVERPGSAEVYQQIESSEDCTGLQEMFDTAAANNDGAEPGTDEHSWTLGYMEAADERMRELDCY